MYMGVESNSSPGRSLGSFMDNESYQLINLKPPTHDLQISSRKIMLTV